MEFNFKILKKKNHGSKFENPSERESCELKVELDLNDIVLLLENNKVFNKLHSNTMQGLSYEMEQLTTGNILLKITGTIRENI